MSHFLCMHNVFVLARGKAAPACSVLLDHDWMKHAALKRDRHMLLSCNAGAETRAARPRDCAAVHAGACEHGERFWRKGSRPLLPRRAGGRALCFTPGGQYPKTLVCYVYTAWPFDVARGGIATPCTSDIFNEPLQARLHRALDTCTHATTPAVVSQCRLTPGPGH